MVLGKGHPFVGMIDRWGTYGLLIGHEAPGHCFWCGAEVKNRRFCAFIGPVKSYLDPYTHKWRRDEYAPLPRSWCDFQYWRHFGWGAASAWCWERADHKCVECGTYTEPPSRRTHHITPLNGQPRAWSILNRPENLLALCAHHHGLKHGQLKKEEEGSKKLLEWKKWALQEAK